MNDNELLFSLVTQRPLNISKLEEVKCPYCKSPKSTEGHSRSTLLGRAGSIDPNHYWHEKTCNECRKFYIVEKKEHNIWITDRQHKVLAGLPSCFESYIYECKLCGGEVHRHYTSLEGKPTTALGWNYLETGEPQKLFRTFFECQSCHTKIETKNDYYTP
jgi:hypothetical protein